MIITFQTGQSVVCDSSLELIQKFILRQVMEYKQRH